MISDSVPVHCKVCDGVFMAGPVSPWNGVQCPHCAHQMPRSECRPAQIEAQEVRRELLVTEEEVAENTREARQQLQTKWLIGLGAVIALAAVGLLMRGGFNRDREKRLEAAGATPEFRPENQKRITAAWEAAEATLSAPDWRSALPGLREAERITPVMERYHAGQPWQPLHVAGRGSARLSDHEGLPFVELEASLSSGRRPTLVMQETPDGWKLDWELLADAPRFEWDDFIRTQPREPRRLRVYLLRASVRDGYCLAAGVEPSRVLALRVWAGDPGDSVTALVPKDSPAGRELEAATGWKAEQPYLVDAAFADPSALPPRIELKQVVKKGWEWK